MTKTLFLHIQLLLYCILLYTQNIFCQEPGYRYSSIHSSIPNVDLNSRTRQLCFFKVEDLNKMEDVYFDIYGSDYDVDKDGKYTNLVVFVNDELFWGPELFVNYNFGRDGKIAAISFSVKKQLHEGNNSVKIINVEDSTKLGYVYIQSFNVYSKKKEYLFMSLLKKSVIPLLIIAIVFMIIRVIYQIFNSKS
jgi:hypothetical protein